MSLFSWYLTNTEESKHVLFATYNKLKSRKPEVSKSKQPKKNPSQILKQINKHKQETKIKQHS